MKKIIHLVAFLLCYSAYGQSLTVFDIDTSAFPTIKAKFYAFDASGKQITNLSPADFELKENGVTRTVTNVSCPSPKPPQIVSLAMSIDVSGSMRGSNAGDIPVELGKTTARDLINLIASPPSELALQTCEAKALIINDFTTNKSKLLTKIDPITAGGDNDFVEQLLNPNTGLLNLVKTGKYKKVALIYTDAWWYALTDAELKRCIDTCTKYGIQFYAAIYTRPEAEPNGIKKSLQLLANATGGYLWDGITTVNAAKELANRLQEQVQRDEPCTIEWQSGANCQVGLINVNANIPSLTLTADASYQSPSTSIAKLEFSPISIYFKNIIPGTKKDTTIKVTARNTDFIITNITSSNPTFNINPISFSLKKGESKDLIVSYTPIDSNYTFTKFTFENNLCTSNYYSAGNFLNTKPKVQTLKLTYPNGGEEFIIGIDTLITWEGIPESDTVKLEYSIDSGRTWKLITNAASGLKYIWKDIPKPTSKLCLVKAEQFGGITVTDKYIWTSLLIGYDVKWSPDGSKIATCSGNTVTILDAKSLETTYIFTGNSNSVHSICFSPDGSNLAFKNPDGNINIRDVASGKIVVTFTEYADANSICFSPDGRTLAYGSGYGVILRDVGSGKLISTLIGHRRDVYSVSFSPDGRTLASGSSDSTIKLWEVATGKEIRTLKDNNAWIYSVSFSPDGKTIASGGSDGKVKLWEVATGQLTDTLPGNGGGVYCVSFSPDGSKLVAGCWNGIIKLWEVTTRQLLNTLTENSSKVNSVCFSPDGNTLASGSTDNSITLWEVATGKEIRSLSGHGDYVFSVSSSPDGITLASGSNDGTIKLWVISNGKEIRTITGHNGLVFCVSFSPDGKTLASASNDGTIKLWEVDSGNLIRTLTGYSRYGIGVKFSPDGSMLVSISDSTIKLCEVSTGKEIRTFKGHRDYVYSVSFSPDGSTLASGSFDSTIKLWEVGSGKEIRTITGHNGWVNSVSFSPDGSTLASGSDDNTLKLWEVATGKEIRTLLGHNRPINSVSFSLDGNMLASGSEDAKIKVWEVGSGRLFRTLIGHGSGVNSVEFCSEGNILASGSFDKTVKLWAIDNIFLQEDQSDNVFSIVTPQASSVDIDMKQCLVGAVKDSVVAGFVQNAGTYKFRVDSIYFTGADASAFKLVGGLPKYILNPSENKNAEFLFIPNRVDIHTATINIITQSDTLKQSIQGEGVLPTLAVLAKILDFGQVEIGNEKTYQDTILIQNISGSPITINDVVQLGPDKTQFEIINGGGSFVLQTNESRKLTIKFKPIFGGRTSGQLGFEYSGVGSPAIAQLFGTGIGGLVTVTNDSAYAGEHRVLKLIMSKVKPEGIASIAPNYEVKIRFQSTILSPEDRTNLSISNDSAYFTVSGTLGTTVELAQIPVIAGLGSVEETSVDIVDIALKDNLGNRVDYDFETQSGTFKLLGICREGGNRLVNPNSQAGMLKVAPNPTDGTISVEFSVTEKGNTELCIYNILGEKVKTIFSENVSEYNKRIINYDVQDLSSGQYMILFRTPTFNESMQLMLLK
ncbi:MAG: choice-of-anchor D domain-containing protein [Bacteroidota bacterium]